MELLLKCKDKTGGEHLKQSMDLGKGILEEVLSKFKSQIQVKKVRRTAEAEDKIQCVIQEENLQVH